MLKLFYQADRVLQDFKRVGSVDFIVAVDITVCMSLLLVCKVYQPIGKTSL